VTHHSSLKSIVKAEALPAKDSAVTYIVK